MEIKVGTISSILDFSQKALRNFQRNNFMIILIVNSLDQCDVEPKARKECGYMGIKQPECESKGCCWSPLENGSKAPWCFFPAKKGKLVYSILE